MHAQQDPHIQQCHNAQPRQCRQQVFPLLRGNQFVGKVHQCCHQIEHQERKPFVPHHTGSHFAEHHTNDKDTDHHGHHNAVDVLEQTAGSRLSGSLTATAVEQERRDRKIQQPQQERVQICLPAGRKDSFYARSVVFGHGKDHIDTREQQVIGIPEKSRSRRIRQKRQGIHHRRLQRQYTEPRQKKQDSGKQQVRENSTGNAHGNQHTGNHQKTHTEQARRKGQQAVHQQSDILVCKSTGDDRSQRAQHQQQDYPQQHGSGITQVQGDPFMGQRVVQV